jgi:hypothetical protein
MATSGVSGMIQAYERAASGGGTVQSPSEGDGYASAMADERSQDEKAAEFHRCLSELALLTI